MAVADPIPIVYYWDNVLIETQVKHYENHQITLEKGIIEEHLQRVSLGWR